MQEREPRQNQEYQDLKDFLGDQKQYSEVRGSGLEKESLFITRKDNRTIILEYLEPGNINNVFCVTPTETKMERKHSAFSQGVQTTDQAPDKTLGDVLRRFELR